jgi:hypothetical protein
MSGLNKDDIIRMAAKSGMHFYQFGWTTGDDPNNLYPECVYTENLEKFAELVAAAEREVCAKVCEVEAEGLIGMAYEGIALGCAESIRARGQE